MPSHAAPNTQSHRADMFTQLSNQTFALGVRQPTHRDRVQVIRQYSDVVKSFVFKLAHDYKLYGKYYRNLPARHRYHRLAKPGGMAAQAKADFVISPTTRELPVMISLLNTCQIKLSETESLLAEPVSVFELDGVYSNLMSVNVQIDHALPIMGKMHAAIGLYENLVVPERNAVGDWGAETNWYEPRQFRQAQEWNDALPEICDGTLPVADSAAVRREATRTVLAATAWAKVDAAVQGRPRAKGRRATI